MTTVLEENHDGDAGLPATKLQSHHDNEEWEVFSLFLNGKYGGLNVHKKKSKTG
jgi:hypothetical protein